MKKEKCLNEFMTIQDVARKLNYTEHGVRIARERQKIKAVRKGKIWLVHKDEFLRFKKNQKIVHRDKFLKDKNAKNSG